MSNSANYLRAIRGSGGGLKGQRSVMFRDLSGEIRAWDQSSEMAYGFSRTKAIGASSHNLLKTIFPEPLRVINSHLLSERKWSGELIHTRINGEQVKVLSNWEVIEDSSATPIVRETNAFFTPLGPETAQLKEKQLEFKAGQPDNNISAQSSTNAIKQILAFTAKLSPIKKLVGSILFFVVLFLSLMFTTWMFTHEYMLHPLVQTNYK